MIHDRLFDLNVEKVLENWGVHHALREVISNAIDEQKLTNTEEIEIYEDEASCWHIRDFGRGLQYQHLTQNENEEKLINESLVIGKFGIGLKDALATFDRHDIYFFIKSKHGDITIEKTTKHNFEDLTTLHAKVKPPSDPDMEGTDFVFANIDDETIDKAKRLFLKFSDEEVLEKTAYGEVLSRQNDTSRIYINGLEVAKEENFLFSYNITSMTAPMRKALNRERSHVGRTAYTPRVKSILLECKKPQVAELLANDLQNHATGSIHDELKWIEISTHATRILNSTKKEVVFMTSEQLITRKDMADEARRKGEQIVVVTEKVAEKISNLTDLSGNRIRDLTQYVQERHDSFRFQFIEPDELTSQEKQVFDCTEDIFNLIGGRPWRVQNVLISEIMRPGDAGLWYEGKSIIVLRSQLKNIQNYAGTLLHEAAHAISRASDVSREFESELTRLLGKVASKALSNFSSPLDGRKRKNDEPATIRPLKKLKLSLELSDEEETSSASRSSPSQGSDEEINSEQAPQEPLDLIASNHHKRTLGSELGLPTSYLRPTLLFKKKGETLSDLFKRF